VDGGGAPSLPEADVIIKKDGDEAVLIKNTAGSWVSCLYHMIQLVAFLDFENFGVTGVDRNFAPLLIGRDNFERVDEVVIFTF